MNRLFYFRFSVAAVLGCLIFAAAPRIGAAEPDRSQSVHGSPYVPLDSWTYPVFRKLAAMGYLPDAEGLTAPWTRHECRMLLNEAKDIASRRSTKVAMGSANKEALRLIAALEGEFPAETPPVARVESLYSRYTQITGPPLRDSYHLGQSIVDDYGRPYGPGANTVDGVSAYAAWGRFSGYVRGEYQQAPSLAAYSSPVRSFIAAADQIPVPPGVASPGVHRFDPVEIYVGAQIGDFNITAGKESIWWGPGEDSAFHFSNNAEAIYMVRVDQTMPFLLPGALRFLGRIRTQFLVGRLAGHEFPPHPLINAQKITLQLSPNLELGFTRSAIFGGVGHPVNSNSFFRSLFSSSSTGGTAFGSANDPGDRRSGFDFSWHLPKLRRYVTIYSDSLADDEPNPLDAPRRSAWGPGIYLTQLPKLPRIDFRLETYSTLLYAQDHGGGFIYWNDQYHDAYTNNGNVLGSWVGRDARVYAASSTYWLSAKNKLTASFRQVKAGGNFLPGGGTQTDVALKGTWQMRPEWLLTAFAQYERYFIPLLGGPGRNVAAGLQVTFYPADWKIQRH
ncbi:MAG: capsule assembly Wzi family protein [Terriglobia bacterium]